MQGNVVVSTLGPHLPPPDLRGDQVVLVRGAGVEAAPALLLHLATAMEEEGEEAAASCIRDIVDLLHLVAEHLVMSASFSYSASLYFPPSFPPNSPPLLQWSSSSTLLPSRTVWW